MNDLALVPAQSLVPADVFKPGGVDALLKSIAEKALAYRPDVSTPKGRSEIASIAYKVAQSKTMLDGMGKDLVAEWKVRASQVDAERRRVRDFLDALKDEVRAPLTEYEEAEAARIAGHEAAIAAIAEAPDYGQTETAAGLAKRLDYLAAYPARDWQEFSRRAADTLAAEVERTTALHRTAVIREAEQAELVRLRAEAEEAARQRAIREQAEREAHIAAEAAERARKEAEARAAADLKAAEDRATAERQAAERAQREAEARARQAEDARIAAAERAEREKAEAVSAEQRRAAAAKAAEEAETARRAANVAHKTKINREVLAALVGCGLTDDLAKVVIASIVRGEVPHVSISY